MVTLLFPINSSHKTRHTTSPDLDFTDKLLQRLCKEGYIIKTREMDGGEEVIEYVLGPRRSQDSSQASLRNPRALPSGGESIPHGHPSLSHKPQRIARRRRAQGLDGPRDVPLPRRKTKKKMMILKRAPVRSQDSSQASLRNPRALPSGGESIPHGHPSLRGAAELRA
jgi:hypothetical protein